MSPGPAPRLIITAGDPAGIGPDICLALARQDFPAAIAVVADSQVLAARARMLGIEVSLHRHTSTAAPDQHQPGRLQVIDTPVSVAVDPGQPDPGNADMVLRSLDTAISACRAGHYDAMVTAPVSKDLLSRRDRHFSGHTEYLGHADGDARPVMMLCAGTLRVALVTTHLSLRDVPDAITPARLRGVIEVLYRDLVERFALPQPRIAVCGLNPHAGENGQLGHEERDIIQPVLAELQRQGLQLDGPLPADTAFLPRQLAEVDAVLAMYHDQGLPVLKYAGFGDAVNVTLGLSFIRTSVDHGTAFNIAGTGNADPSSLYAAVRMAIRLANRSRQ